MTTKTRRFGAGWPCLICDVETIAEAVFAVLVGPHDCPSLVAETLVADVRAAIFRKPAVGSLWVLSPGGADWSRAYVTPTRPIDGRFIYRLPIAHWRRTGVQDVRRSMVMADDPMTLFRCT